MGETKKEKKENIRNFQDELKLIEFYGKQKNLVRNSGIFRQESAISYIKKFLTTPWHTINAKNVQDALSQAINAYGKNNYQAFESFRQSVEPFTKIMLVASKFISPQDYNYEKISSINDARKLLEKTFDERCFISNTDREILSGYLKDGVELRNKWQHNTPSKDDIETHEMGCTTWLLYVFAVAAICYKIDRAHGGIRFLADCDCKLCFTQPEVNPGKSKTPNVLKGEPCQIDARPGAFQLKITLTDNKGRNHTEMRTGTIERDKYIDIKIKASALGRDGAPRFIPNPLLTGMLQEEKKEGIPFKGGTYEGSLNTRKLPHGMGSFIKEGITYSGRFNNGKAEGPFIVKGDGFEYRGTLSFDPIPWGFDKGEMNIEHAGQKLSYKEATFKGMHCAYGCLHLNGKLLYKGSFEAPATGMIPVIRGCGELHSEDGSIYYGEIDKAAPHGRGCLIDISGKAIYTDWFYGEPIGNPQEMILSGDRPAYLFDGKRLVCPISGSPFTLHYIGKPVFILRDEEGNTLPCPELTEAREWKYKFNAPAEKPKEEPKAKPEEKSEETTSKTKPTEAPSKEKPQGEKKPMETSGSSIKKAAKSIPEEDFFAPKIEPKTNKAQTEKKLSAKKGDNGKYGFVDEKGNWCIYPLFEEIGDFKEGMAKIRLDGQYGFINDQGKTIIPPIYNKAWSFLNGLAIVEKNGLYGHINKQGKVVIPIQYKDAYPFQDELDGLIAEVEKEDGSWIFIDKDNKFVKFSDRGAVKEASLPKTALNSNTKPTPQKRPVKIYDYAYGQKLFPAEGENKKYGFVDENDNWVISPRFENAWSFEKVGLAKIKLDGKYGFINKQGKIIVSVIYDVVWPFSEEYAIVEKNHMFGFVNDKGDIAIPLIYEDAMPFTEGQAPIKKSGKWGSINKRGNIIIPIAYDIIRPFSNDIAIVSIEDQNYNTKYGFITKQGKLIVPPQYDNVEDFSEGLAPVRLMHINKYGYINEQGEMVIPYKYDDAYSFHDGLAVVELNKKYGVINKQGNLVIPCQYDNRPFFGGGYALVNQNEKWGIVDQRGEIVLPIMYEAVMRFHEDLAALKLKGKWGFVNKLGKITIPIQYDYVSRFVGGVAIVKLGYKYGLINKQGKIILPIEYNNIENIDINDEETEASLNGKTGHIIKMMDANGQPYFEFTTNPVPKRHREAYNFQEGLKKSSLRTGDQIRYGFINRNMDWVIRPIFWAVHHFDRTCAPVAINNEKQNSDARWGIIDQEGNWILEPKYAYIGFYSNALKGFSARRTDGTWVTITISEE